MNVSLDQVFYGDMRDISHLCDATCNGIIPFQKGVEKAFIRVLYVPKSCIYIYIYIEILSFLELQHTPVLHLMKIILNLKIVIGSTVVRAYVRRHTRCV